jgi:hypothetical protein
MTADEIRSDSWCVRGAGQHRDPLLTRIRREALEDAVRRPEDDLRKGLVGHRPRRRLNAIGEHIAHTRADDPVDFFGLGARAMPPSYFPVQKWS